MTISVVGSTESIVSSGTPLTSVTVSSVATGTRTNGYFAVAVSVMTANGASDITGITWGGVAMSKAAEAGSGVPYVEWWYKLSDAGGTADVVVSFSGTGVTSAHISIVWGDSDDALSIGDFGGVEATTEDPASISLDTTETGALCLGAYSTQDNNVATSGDTLIQDHDAGGNCAGSAHLTAGAPGTHTLDWDRNATGISTIFNMAAFEMYEADAGSSPTVALDAPADAATINDSTPTAFFTNTDADGDDVTDNIQITNNPDDFIGGEITTFAYAGGSGTPIHPNPVNFLISNGSSLDGWRQTDDRPVIFVEARGGLLKEGIAVFGNDEGAACDGTAYMLVYATEGIADDVDDPLRPLGADPDDGGVNSPVPGWLAISDGFAYNPGSNDSNAARTLAFSGANQIRLTPGQVYGFCLLWRPAADEFDNANTISVTTGTASPPPIAQGWIEGRSANYGPVNLLMHLEVVEEFILLDKVSDTDAGFADVTTPAESDPFPSGDQISFTVQGGDALADGVYYWRVRGIDKLGTNVYGVWPTARSFTIDTSGGGSGSTYDEDISLARFQTVASANNLIIEAAATLGRELGVSDGSNLQAEEAATLARTLALAQTGNLLADLAATLSRQAGMAAEAGLLLDSSLSLAHGLAIGLAGDVSKEGAVSLARSLALSAGSQMEAGAAIGLARAMTAGVTSQADFETAVALARTQGIAPVGTLEISAGLSLSLFLTLTTSSDLAGLVVGIIHLTAPGREFDLTAPAREFDLTAREQ